MKIKVLFHGRKSGAVYDAGYENLGKLRWRPTEGWSSLGRSPEPCNCGISGSGDCDEHGPKE